MVRTNFKYYRKLLVRFVIISWQRIRAFNFEFLMMFVHLLFNFSFILIFWGALLQHTQTFGEWDFAELALYSGLTFLGESFGGVFFGFRDLPRRIIDGGLDKFLVRPMNTLFAVLFEQVSVVYYLEELIASVVMIALVIAHYSISIQMTNAIMGVLVLMFGVMIYNCVYGTVTFLAFWFGQVGTFRAIIFGLAESKQYPLSIFPNGLRLFLTYIIPVAFISYYPAAIFLGKIRVNVVLLGKMLVLMLVVFTLFNLVWHKGLKRYEANGG